MNSWTSDHFWDSFNQLPEEIRQQAREAYRQFARDPFAPGLNFKDFRVIQANVEGIAAATARKRSAGD